MKRFKINKTILLFFLYKIEDKRQYECPLITRYIDRLQNKKGVIKSE